MMNPDLLNTTLDEKILKRSKRGLERLLHDTGFEFSASDSSMGDMAAADVDMNIQKIQAYLRQLNQPFNELPDMPRDALKKLATVDKSATPEEIDRIEKHIFKTLHKKYGDFDESTLVLFMTKFIMGQENMLQLTEYRDLFQEIKNLV